MSGIIGMGRQNATMAREGMGRASNLEKNRISYNKQQSAADDAAQASNTAMGATAGWMIGAKAGSVGGPLGMAIGALSGYLLSEWL